MSFPHRKWKRFPGKHIVKKKLILYTKALKRQKPLVFHAKILYNFLINRSKR
jgi:hypothetical protein